MTEYEGNEAIEQIIKNLDRIPRNVETNVIPKNMVDKISDALLKKLRRRVSI